MRPHQQHRTLSKAFMGGSCGKWHTKSLLAISFCSLCSKMPISNLEMPPGLYPHWCKCSPSAVRWLYDGFRGGRKVWAPASGDTSLHHLPWVFRSRSVFPVAMLGMTVPSCFCGRKTVDFSRFLPPMLQVRLYPWITRHNMSFRNDPSVWASFGQSA